MKKISNIKLYNHYVDNKIFQKVIKKSHLLFSDIRVKYSSSDIYEVYGVSKDSGISYLMNEFNYQFSLIYDNKIASNLHLL